MVHNFRARSIRICWDQIGQEYLTNLSFSNNRMFIDMLLVLFSSSICLKID